MKKISLLLLLFLCGCSNTHAFYTIKHKELPIELGNRMAQENSYYILGFIPLGINNATAEIARKHGINKITYVDENYKYYILFSQKERYVYGYSNSSGYNR